MVQRDRPFLTHLIVLAVLLGIASIIPILYLSFRSFAIFNADQAVLGLMGKHILQGKAMVYAYGQSYMGSLESFTAAFIYLFRGMNILSMELVPLFYFFLFLIVNFYLVKEIFGLEVSVIANLLAAISPPLLSVLNLKALGGYPETLFFGSLFLLLLHRAEGSKRKKQLLFFAGFVGGLAFWTNNLIVMYFFALAIFMILRSRWWENIHPSFHWKNILFLKAVRIPLFVRILLILVNLGIVLLE